MAIYINMDKRFIRKGGRAAQSMTLEQFKEILNTALQPFDDDDSGWNEHNMEDYENFHFEQMIRAALGEDPMPPFDKVRADIDKIQVDYENLLLEEFVVTPTGVPAASLIIGGDWELGITAYIYFDGKTLRGYVPLYGNTYNKYLKCAFGSEDNCDSENEYFGKPYVFSTDNAATEMFFDTKEKFAKVNVPQKVVLTEEAYDYFNWDEVVSNSAACLEDFTSRLTVTGPLSDDAFQRAIKKFKKLGEKIRKEMEDEDEDEAEGTSERPPLNLSPEYKDWLAANQKASTRQLSHGTVLHAADVRDCNYLLRRVGETDIEIYPVHSNPQELDDNALAAAIKFLDIVGTHRFRMNLPILYQCDFPGNRLTYDAIHDLIDLILLSTDEFRFGLDMTILPNILKEFLDRNNK